MVFKTSFAPLPGGFSAVVELRQGGTIIQSRGIANLTSDANDNVRISLDSVPAGTFSIMVRFVSTSTGLTLAEATFANVQVIAGGTTTVSEIPSMNRSFDQDGDNINNVDEIRAGTDPSNRTIFPRNLTVDKRGNGTVTSNPSGIDCGADCTELYSPGTSVILTPTPDPGALFVGWGGECSGTSTCTVVMSAAKNVTATFATSTTTITTTTTTTTTTTNTTTTTMTTTTTTTTNRTTTTMTTTTTTTTNRTTTTTTTTTTLPSVTLSVGASSLNEDTGMTSTPVTATLSGVSDRVVTVGIVKSGTAIENADYTLPGVIVIPAGVLSASITLAVLSDLLNEVDETVIIDISVVTNGTENGVQQKTVTIVDNDVTLRVVLSGNGTVTSSPFGINCGADCTETYSSGTSVRLTPSPNLGSLFVGWGGECSGTGPCTVVMNTDKTVTATFIATFIALANLSADSGTSLSAASGSTLTRPRKIAISGSTVMVTWRDDTSENADIFVARSIDGGANFSSPVNFSNNSGFSGFSQVAISGSTVLVTWHDHTPGNAEIFVARSTDGGANFSPRVNISNNSGVSAFPQVAISGSTVLVMWHDTTPGNFDIFVACSTNGGADFSSPVNLSNNSGQSFEPQVAISGSTVLVTWHDTTPGNFDIFVARSTNGGANFFSPVNLSNNSGDSGFPQEVTISGSTVLVMWHDNTPGNNDIFLARSTDGGANFSPPVNLSNNSGSSALPQVAISGSTVLVTWYDNTPGNNDIFVARSTDGGATFAAPVNISNNAGDSFRPQIAISGSTVLVTWRDDTPGNADIFFARSTDGGATFSAPVNLSGNSGNSSSPQIAISGSTALVTWQDNTHGNSDIFFTRLEFP